jgi:hypothetical protein
MYRGYFLPNHLDPSGLTTFEKKEAYKNCVRGAIREYLELHGGPPKPDMSRYVCGICRKKFADAYGYDETTVCCNEISGFLEGEECDDCTFMKAGEALVADADFPEIDGTDFDDDMEEKAEAAIDNLADMFPQTAIMHCITAKARCEGDCLSRCSGSTGFDCGICCLKKTMKCIRGKMKKMGKDPAIVDNEFGTLVHQLDVNYEHATGNHGGSRPFD